MAHSKFIDRIANIYIEKYHKLGMRSAAEYGGRVTKDNPDLGDEIQQVVSAKIAAALKGGPNDKGKQ